MQQGPTGVANDFNSGSGEKQDQAYKDEESLVVGSVSFLIIIFTRGKK